MAEQGTSDQLTQEIDAFKEDIRQLQRDLGEMLASSGSYGRERLHENKERIRTAMGHMRDHAEERAAHAYEAVREGGAHAVEYSRQSIGHRPLTAILIAFAAGVLVSLLGERTLR